LLGSDVFNRLAEGHSLTLGCRLVVREFVTFVAANSSVIAFATVVAAAVTVNGIAIMG